MVEQGFEWRFEIPNVFFVKSLIKCDGLRIVFSVSVIKHFPHLEELHLADCLSMKQVVAYDEGKEYVGTNVVSPQLHTLRFVNPPNLTSFCEGAFIVEFPSLEYLNLEAYPDMRTFSLGPLVTPKLNAIALENGEQLWKDDLNSTIKHSFMAKV
ncbi:putative leucine-rich repeat domain superfamily [Helianthus anomalus]